MTAITKREELIERVLIVGYGSMGKRHLYLARELIPDADIRILRHDQCASIPTYANGCFSCIEEAISFCPQVAVIASPATFHMSMAIALARAGVHLMIEKPLSAHLEGTRELLDICDAKRCVLLIGYNLRYLDSLQRYRRLLLEQEIRRVFSVRCEVGQFLPSWRPTSDYRQGVSARRDLGGGVLLELSHELDYLLWIFGEVDWVCASMSRQSNLDIDTEDTTHLILGFKESSDGHQLIANVNLDFIRHDRLRLCTAIGENGSLRWDGITGTIEKFHVNGKSWVKLFHQEGEVSGSYRTEWEHFLKCIQGQVSPLVSGEDGVNVLKVIEGARQASETGCKIYLKNEKLIGAV